VRYVDLIVPTRNRAAKLERMLESVPQEAAGKPIRIILACDGDSATYAKFKVNEKIHRAILSEKQIGSVAIRNLATAEAEDAVLMAVDDIVFDPGAIEAAISAFEERFPDDDGVVGFTQTNHKDFSATGVPLVGQAFLQRYPGKRLYYPGYFHFACQEIERLARTLGKLWVEPEARLYHAHPSTGHGPMDKTHAEARVRRTADLTLSQTRKRAGEIWGRI
jgi:glycosyltransferase involved in cell wall biosynthesis